ncbi:MAG: flagellar brake protein [Paucimonas sp.]|nr:flagellar brake protein [Paucimonas sp.]
MSSIPNLEEIDERYFVRGRMEIQGVLSELVYRGELLEIGHEGEEPLLQATLLDVNRSGVIFDVAPDASPPKSALPSTLAFIARPDGIRVQFHCAGVESVKWDGRPVYRAALPDCVARLQRQESLRTWIAEGHVISIAFFDADGALLGEQRLRDLSAGGLGIIADTGWAQAMAFRVERVRFTVAPFGDIDCAVALRHLTIQDDDLARIGLAFLQPAAEMRGRVQRFVLENELQRRQVETDESDGSDGA